MASKLSKGFRELLIKSGVFVVLFVLIQIITAGIVADTTLPGDLKFLALDDIAEAALFMLVIFIGFNREKILKVKSYSGEYGIRIMSFVLMMLGFVGYFKYKFFLVNNLELASKYIYLFTFIEYLFLFIILFLLAVVVFGFRFCQDFSKEHKKWIFYVLVGTGVVYFLIKQFQNLWIPISRFVGDAVNYFLNFAGTSNIYYIFELPVISFEGFVVGIAKTCSGIDSVLLFTGLYLGIMAWDWAVLDKRKALMMYFVGVLGAFVLNIIRISALVMLGAYVSRDFALGVFHTNASSLLFIIYFGIFWKYTYKWMKIKEKK
ncbi:MAG: archaeosortase/exosortase family protein [Nanoarchaeota archaeon]|nr:archaeosortase/exosortase family protein [Nanoarchaeota archaeon]